MLNKSVVSVGLFGRLSCLAAKREDVLERIRHVEEDNHYHGPSTERQKLPFPEAHLPKPDASFAQALPTLLTELNALVEAIVLSDEVLVFCGHSDEQLARLHSHGYRPISHMNAFYLTQVWPDEANTLEEIALDAIPCTWITIDDPAVMDAEIALEYPHKTWNVWPVEMAIRDGKLDYRILGDIDPEDMDVGAPESEAVAMEKVLTFVDSSLGDEWRLYKDVVQPLRAWPAGLLLPQSRRPYHVGRPVQMKLGLFAELRAAQAHGTLAASSIHTGQFYPLLAAQQHVVAGQLREVVARQYAKRLHQQLDELGVACLDLRLPPILRLCLADANSILDVVRHASRLRRDRLFVRLRRHLCNVANAGEPVKLLRQLRQLHEWIERSLAGLGDLPNASVGMGTASASVSLVSVAKHMLAWRNPVVLVHSRLQRMLAGRDTIGDLARVLGVGRAVAAHAVTRTNLMTPDSLQNP